MIEIRAITQDEVVAFQQAISAGFGSDSTEPEAAAERFTQIHDLAKTLAVFDDGHIVGTFGSYDLDMTVPGGSLPMAGTTIVTVSPTHRRRGLLTSMMTTHLNQAVQSGKPLAGLWASEEQIYGRFGYGPAAGGFELRLSANVVGLPAGPPDVTLHPLPLDDARDELPPIYDRFSAATSGCFTRRSAWWEVRHFHDPKHRRPPGATTRRYVIARRGGVGVGYVVYRQTDKYDAGIASGVVDVIELVADDDDVRRTLWKYLTEIDLFPNVFHWNAPIDEPLLVEADRFRSVSTHWNDSLWLRILDVARALEGRCYERDGSLTLRVNDPFLDLGGTFTLDVSDGIGRCAPTEGAADIALDIDDLGRLYLGGAGATRLARAGRVVGDEPSVRLLDDMFRTAAAPLCSEVF